jgi:hypothetical protein
MRFTGCHEDVGSEQAVTRLMSALPMAGERKLDASDCKLELEGVCGGGGGGSISGSPQLPPWLKFRIPQSYMHMSQALVCQTNAFPRDALRLAMDTDHLDFFNAQLLLLLALLGTLNMLT